MIRYICDMCKKDIDKDVHIIDEFPRKVSIYAYGMGDIKVASFYKYDLAETHLCDACFKRIADMLQTAE